MGKVHSGTKDGEYNYHCASNCLNVTVSVM